MTIINVLLGLVIVGLIAVLGVLWFNPALLRVDAVPASIPHAGIPDPPLPQGPHAVRSTMNDLNVRFPGIVKLDLGSLTEWAKTQSQAFAFIVRDSCPPSQIQMGIIRDLQQRNFEYGMAVLGVHALSTNADLRPRWIANMSGVPHIVPILNGRPMVGASGVKRGADLQAFFRTKAVAPEFTDAALPTPSNEAPPPPPSNDVNKPRPAPLAFAAAQGAAPTPRVEEVVDGAAPSDSGSREEGDSTSPNTPDVGEDAMDAAAPDDANDEEEATVVNVPGGEPSTD